MPKDVVIDLKELIGRLNKAEKRNFRLFLNRRSGDRELKYGALFDALEKSRDFDQKKFLLEHPDIKSAQLSNLKSSLYDHLLENLRQQSTKKDVELRIREKIDYAAVLYNKGLLRQSRQMLEKVNRLAERYQLDELRFELLYREKIVELHFSGNNSVSRATELREQVEEASQQIERINAFAGFALQLHAHFVEFGYLENKKDLEQITEFYEQSIPVLPKEDLTFNERIFYNRAQYWFYYIQQDFVRSYRYSLATERLIREYELELHRPVIYLKTMNQMLNSLFRMNEAARFLKGLNELQLFVSKISKNPSEQERLLSFRFLAHHRINSAFLRGDFKMGVELVSEIKEGMNDWGVRLESRNVITLNYKFACLYFGVGDYNQCLIYLNRIIHQDDLSYRQDIHGYARILRLVALFEQGEVDLLFKNIRSTYQFFVRQKNLDDFHQEIIGFLRKSTRYYPQKMLSEFDALRARMEQIAEDPLKRKPFYYFDIISWLDSQVRKVPVADVIRERGLGHEQLF